MTCREILSADDGRTFEDNVEIGKSLYCMDPETFNSTSDLGQAVAACTNSTTGVVGSIMKKTCGNYWYDTVDGVQSYTHLYAAGDQDGHNNTNNGSDTGKDDSSGVDNVLKHFPPFVLVILALLPLIYS